MTQYKVILTYDIPENISYEQFEEWVRFEIIRKSPCRNDNPLVNDNVDEYISDYEIGG